MTKIWSIAEVTAEINQTLNDNPDFSNCWISAEISNYKNHRPSGHWYFTLKDSSASLKAVMFKSRAERVRFVPQDGLKVLVRGNVRFYERDGNVQLYVEEMQPSGVGGLYLAFEQLKQRLATEGLFDASRKKAIPIYPRKIGLVTSPTGAALQDMIKVMHRRNPNISWILAPAAVQGESAPSEISKAIRRLNQYGKIDVLIVGRGGGSIEELWAFNTEEVARAIVASAIPVISAVGHETDITISDLVADLRAATPSAAAELAVPVHLELISMIQDYERRLNYAMLSQIQLRRKRIEVIASRGPLSNPFWRIDQNRQRLDTLSERLELGMTRFISDKNGILTLLASKLDLLSPLSILGRGYSLTYGPKGNVLHSSDEINVGGQVQVRLHEGSLTCAVLSKERSKSF